MIIFYTSKITSNLLVLSVRTIFLNKSANVSSENISQVEHDLNIFLFSNIEKDFEYCINEDIFQIMLATFTILLQISLKSVEDYLLPCFNDFTQV